MSGHCPECGNTQCVCGVPDPDPVAPVIGLFDRQVRGEDDYNTFGQLVDHGDGNYSFYAPPPTERSRAAHPSNRPTVPISTLLSQLWLMLDLPNRTDAEIFAAVQANQTWQVHQALHDEARKRHLV